MTKTYRVVAWSTGNVGVHAIAGIDARPDLELVGVWVSNPDKVGRDAGDLAGLGRNLGWPPPTTSTGCSRSSPTSWCTPPWPTTG